MTYGIQLLQGQNFSPRLRPGTVGRNGFSDELGPARLPSPYQCHQCHPWSRWLGNPTGSPSFAARPSLPWPHQSWRQRSHIACTSRHLQLGTSNSRKSLVIATQCDSELDQEKVSSKMFEMPAILVGKLMSWGMPSWHRLGAACSRFVAMDHVDLIACPARTLPNTKGLFQE